VDFEPDEREAGWLAVGIIPAKRGLAFIADKKAGFALSRE
jgi:hypothetical protein